MGSSKDVTTIYITRHGETECNRNSIVQGRGVDVPLNETGVLQAELLANRLKEQKIDEVYSSTLLRARQTANILVRERENNSITYLRDLEEMSWGEYEGMGRSDDMIAAFNEMKQAWAKRNYGYRIKGGETLLEVQKRGIQAFNSIVRRHTGKTILLVSHGRFIRILLASIVEGYTIDRMGALKQGNTAFNHLMFVDGLYQAEKLNCLDHLEGMS